MSGTPHVLPNHLGRTRPTKRVVSLRKVIGRLQRLKALDPPLIHTELVDNAIESVKQLLEWNTTPEDRMDVGNRYVGSIRLIIIHDEQGPGDHVGYAITISLPRTFRIASETYSIGVKTEKLNGHLLTSPEAYDIAAIEALKRAPKAFREFAVLMGSLKITRQPTG